MRAFLAVPVPEEVREAVVLALSPLRAAAPKVRWVPAEHWHLTLKFLGEIEAEAVDAFGALLDRCVAGRAPIDLQPRALRLFPRPRRARVVALTFAGVPERLIALAHELDLASGALGVPVETRAFRPHLTLGRIRHPVDGLPLERTCGDLEGAYPLWRVEKIQLYQSVLGAQGPRHTLLHTACLADLPAEG